MTGKVEQILTAPQKFVLHSSVSICAIYFTFLHFLPLSKVFLINSSFKSLKHFYNPD